MPSLVPGYGRRCAVVLESSRGQVERQERHKYPREQTTDQGSRLEVMTIAATVAATHYNGFAGITLNEFLSEMVHELGLQRPATAEAVWSHAIPSSLCQRVVPFLAPPDMEWPVWLPQALNVGSIHRSRNGDHIDFCIGESGSSSWFTGEYKDLDEKLNLGMMKVILKYVKPTCAIHVVITNWLQASYFEDGMFQSLVQEEEDYQHLQDTLFLQYGTDASVREISGMENTVATPDRVVLFVARLDPASCPEAGRQVKRVKVSVTTLPTSRYYSDEEEDDEGDYEGKVLTRRA